MDKTAISSYPIHELHARRWSPLSFSERPLARQALGSLLEAARWSASSFNEQPWSFLVATRDETAAFERLKRCLVPGNQAWAKGAPVLMLSVAKLHFEKNGKPNRHAFHDVGMATSAMMLQAVALGLDMHAMAGFDIEQARRELGIPDGWEPVAMIAVGYRGRPEDLPGELRKRELAPRTRKELARFAFGGRWGEPLAGV